MRREAAESKGVLVALALVHVSVVWLYLRELATDSAIVAGAIAAVGGALLARFADRRYLRLPLGATFAIAGTLAAFPIGQAVLDGGLGPSAHATLLLGDAVFFSLLAVSLVFGLRFLASRVRLFAALEALYIVGAVTYMFAAHRNQMIHRPRWLTDWAWSRGIDPQLMLQLFGVVIAVLAVTTFLRRQRALKLVLSALAVALVGWLVYRGAERLRLDPEIDTSGLSLSDDKDESGRGGKGDGSSSGKDGDGEGGGSSDGKGDGKGGGSNGNGAGGGSTPPPPLPVAVAVFHEDYEPESGILYFRQQVLSRYDGHHLVADDGGFDADVITAFPHDGPILAAPEQAEAFHKRVPVSMYLMVDHPQPLALTASVEIAPIDNPAPRRFVAAYSAASFVLAQPTARLIGRQSMPDDWTPEQRHHYLEVPDDPRYASLADEILRGLDPRFAGDDLMKAFALKRWLEANGFYTRKERHATTDDPAASFLFGSLRGYCVHFAHAAVLLFRSQGIAARVAIGYAVDNRMRGAGSTVLILGDRAHAWPEIHLAGVGWVPFDIYPERSDEPPPRMVDQSLESLLGELARDDKTGGRSEEAMRDPFRIPWTLLVFWLLVGFAATLALAYAVKIGRLAAAAAGPTRAYAATLDRFSDVGGARHRGETRERHAARLAALAPSMPRLTAVHLKLTLGAPTPEARAELLVLCRQVRVELADGVPALRRALGWLNPVGWWFTR